MATTYEPIATQTLASPQLGIDFTSIPATYTDLRLVIVGGSTSTARAVRLNFNLDSATNYSYTRILGNGTSATSDRTSNDTAMDIGYFNTNIYNISINDIMNYTNTTTFKTVLTRWNTTDYTVGAVGLWRKTPEAINRIGLTSGTGFSFPTGTTATLYGIKAA